MRFPPNFYDDVSDLLQGSYEELTRKLLPWNLGYSVDITPCMCTALYYAHVSVKQRIGVRLSVCLSNNPIFFSNVNSVRCGRRTFLPFTLVLCPWAAVIRECWKKPYFAFCGFKLCIFLSIGERYVERHFEETDLSDAPCIATLCSVRRVSLRVLCCAQ